MIYCFTDNLSENNRSENVLGEKNLEGEYLTFTL